MIRLIAFASLLASTPQLAAGVPALDVRARGEISAAIGLDDPAYHVGADASADNAAQRFAARFLDDGVWFDAGWGLAYDGWKCGSVFERATPDAPARTANRVSYAHGAVTDWYVNGPFGLQHGATIASLPEGCDGARIELRYRVLGSVSPRVLGDDAIEFGAQRYAGLASWDARGRALPARMRLESGERVLVLDVEGADAALPIVVDPFVQSAQLATIDPGAGLYGGRVAVSGDTAIVGDHGTDIAGAADRGAAYVFVRSSGVWQQQARLVASDGAAADFFGWGIALLNDIAVIGAFGDDTAPGADQGAAYVFERVGSLWFERQKLTAPDAAAGALFGYSASISGDRIAVGALSAAVAANAEQGKAYVYFRTGIAPSWSFEQTLTALDGAASDFFGAHVSLSGDTVLVTASGDDVGANADQGSAYVFDRSGGTWVQQQKLLPSDGGAGDGFGLSGALFGDTAVVGSFSADVPPNANQGAAYVYTRSGPTWSPQQKLVLPNGAPNQFAGFSIALSGQVVAVGAFGRDADRGGIAIFRRSGGVWEFLEEVRAANAPAGHRFGGSAALDGMRLVGGATPAGGGGTAYVFDNPTLLTESAAGDSADPDGITDDQTGASVATAVDLMAVGAPEVGGRGVVYLYQLKGTSSQTPGCGTNLDSVLVATLTNTGGGIGDKFGRSVAMSTDGNTIVIGAPEFNTRGRVAVFRRPGSAWTGTIDVATADTIAPALVTGDKFGTSVSIGGDGTIAVGAPGNDAQGTDAGAAMTFRPAGIVYDDVPEGTAVSMSPQAGAAFGTSLSLESGMLIVGAPLEDNLAPNSTLLLDAGAAYAYDVAANGTPSAQGGIEPANGGGIGDKFGTSVGVSNGTMVVGAPGTDTAAGTDSGAAFVYEDTAGPPSFAGMLVPEDGAGQQAGSSVGIAGEYVTLGAPLADVGAMDGEGASYLYEEPEAGWSSGPPPQLKAHLPEKRALGGAAFLPSNRVSPIKRQPDQAFGTAIGLTRRGLAIGAPLRDDDIPNCASDIVDEGGADAYLFDRVFRNGFE